jgi:hypothetical protein
VANIRGQTGGLKMVAASRLLPAVPDQMAFHDVMLEQSGKLAHSDVAAFAAGPQHATVLSSMYCCVVLTRNGAPGLKVSYNLTRRAGCGP